jgi:transcriptional regulator with XRE-family HTH domain
MATTFASLGLGELDPVIASMTTVRSIPDWLAAHNRSLADLVAATGLDRRVVEAIAAGRYTPSPEQRRALAVALGIEPDQVAWGHQATVEHIHGHGPQFGRSP